MTDNTQPEAGSTHIIRYALEMGLLWIAGDGRDKVREALDALDTLETQLASIRAGGVTGPLVGQPQAMPDLSALTERGAKAWAGVDAQGLREGFTAADMATAAAQGFRDGVASLSANAGEPVAWLYESPMPDGSVFTGASAERLQVGVGTPPGTIEKPLYLAAPPTAQAEGWRLIPVEPTGEMLTAAEMALYEARSTLGRYAAHKAAYRALLAAAPPPPTSVEGVEHG